MKKLPLAERLRRCLEGRAAYPEYVPAVIRDFAEAPVAAYMAELPVRSRVRFMDLTGIHDEVTTYQQAALRIAQLPRQQALEVMELLAEPMRRCLRTR